MRTLHDAIGQRFEEFFLERLPGFEDHTADNERRPDFYNPQYGFWVETKVGNIGWGVRLKQYQQANFPDIEEEVVYFCGLHDFNQAIARLSGKTKSQRRAILKRDMHIVETYFVDRRIVEKVWEKENRLNEKGTIVYCMMKAHIFRDLILNRSFRRFGQRVANADRYYGLDRTQFSFDSFRDNPAGGFITGLMLQRKNSGARTYLSEQGLL